MKKGIVIVLGLLLVSLFAVSVQAASVTCDIKDQNGGIIPEATCQFIQGTIVGTATSGNSVDLADGTYIVRYHPAVFAHGRWGSWTTFDNVRKQDSLVVAGDTIASETFGMSQVTVDLRDQHGEVVTKSIAYFQFLWGALGKDSNIKPGEVIMIPKNSKTLDPELIGYTAEEKGGYGYILVRPEYDWSSPTLSRSRHDTFWSYIVKWKKIIVDEDQETFSDVWPYFKGKVGLYKNGNLVEGSKFYYNAISTMYNDDELKLPSNDPSIEGLETVKPYDFGVFPGDTSEAVMHGFHIYEDGRLEPSIVTVDGGDYTFVIGEPAQPPVVDNDGDGANADVDCNDADATVYPGAPELACDFVDNNCDGLVDESAAAPVANLIVNRLEKNVLPVGKYVHASLYSVQSDFTVACEVESQNLVLSACGENVNLEQGDIVLVTSKPGKGKNAAVCELQRIAVDTLDVAKSEKSEKSIIEVVQVSNGMAVVTTAVTGDHKRTATATTKLKADGSIAPVGHQVVGSAIAVGGTGTQTLLIVAVVAIVAIVAMAYGAVTQKAMKQKTRRRRR